MTSLVVHTHQAGCITAGNDVLVSPTKRHRSRPWERDIVRTHCTMRTICRWHSPRNKSSDTSCNAYPALDSYLQPNSCFCLCMSLNVHSISARKYAPNCADYVPDHANVKKRKKTSMYLKSAIADFVADLQNKPQLNSLRILSSLQKSMGKTCSISATEMNMLGI